MPQIFHRSANAFSRFTIFGSVFLIAGIAYVATKVNRSPYFTHANVVREQPVPFSHQHHSGQLGIDCRYCHTSVEEGAFAGMPPTKTCMTCHSQIWTNAAMLEPVRESYRSERSIEWTRVHDLPDFAYFNHSIHVNKGVACESCHGRVDEMPLMYQASTLHMEWCLDCHRHPEKFVRPREAVFQFGWEAPEGDRAAFGRELLEKYNVRSLTDCYTCHR
jgi:hypothetical protein